MQLIDIVLLVLVGFIALSLIIFLFSYVGYLTRRRIKKDDFKYGKNENPIIPINVKKKSVELKPEYDQNPVNKDGLIQPENVNNKQSKFEVFKPAKDNSRVHNPKIIIANFSKETFKKK